MSKVWAFLSNLATFTMPTHQIWSCHLIQKASFDFFKKFFLILHLILGKVTKVLVEKPSTFEVIRQKPLHTFRVKHTFLFL